MKTNLRLVIFLGIGLFGASCTHQLPPKRHQELPKSSGVYGGSFIYDTWVYKGTNKYGNHLTYSWNRGNFLRKHKFVAPIEMIDEPDRFKFTKNYKDWKTAQLVMNTEGEITAFKVVSTKFQQMRNHPIIFTQPQK